MIDPFADVLNAAQPPHRARLLVVDDQPASIQALYAVLSESHDIFMATSGEKALELCAASPPDLVLMDVVMPGMDGLTVCHQLKQYPQTRDIPVIFITAHERPEEEEACWTAGGVDFITKPIQPTTVRNRVRAHLTLKFQADLLRRMAMIDALTGASNRRAFDEKLDAEWRRCQRNGKSLALLLADIDYFKQYNDSQGHQAGDDCLRTVSGAMQGALKRPGDILARYGGEEFAAILPETELDNAVALATQMREAVQALALPHPGSRAAPVVTISVGVAAVTQGMSGPDGLISLADERLYQAKNAGRNRIVAA